MEPVTVTWNGDQHVQSATEIPAEGLTAGEYLAALVDAHTIGGVDHELVMADGEPVPADLDVALLSGLTVNVRAQDPVELVADEPQPYDQWDKAALRAEIDARNEAGAEIAVAKRAGVDVLAAALEKHDAERPDAVFVEPDGTVELADGEVVGAAPDADTAPDQP